MLQPNATTTSTITFAGDEYKYAVADILTSFASGEPSNPTTVNSIFSTATSTTDLLTPTTLASLEQSLADIQEGSSSKVAHESGFIPPVVNTAPSTTAQMVKQEYSDFIYDDDSSLEQDSQWFGPGGKRSRYESNAIVIQPFSPASSSTTSTTTNRRRRLRDENLTPEEMERRNIRRERNKIAAAKCRQRRVDLTNKLIVESEGLEEEQSKLENEIQMLQQQKEQLEFLLEAHKPVCSAKVSIKQQSAVKSEKSDVTYTSIISASPSISASSTYQASTASSGNTSTARPNTLPIPTRPQNQALCSVTEATGVSITTPSSVFNFGLESMIDGHTGLTPITGTPSCASQIQRNSTDGSSSSENLSSPTTLMAL